MKCASELSVLYSLMFERLIERDILTRQLTLFWELIVVTVVKINIMKDWMVVVVVLTMKYGENLLQGFENVG